MAFSINQIIIAGKIGRDAEISETKSGVAVAKFSVATTHGVKKGDEWENITTWHNVVFYKPGRNAESLVKGATVTVRGRQEHRQYQGKDGSKKIASEIVAEDVVVAYSNTERSSYQPPAAQPVQGSWEADDSDVPF